MDAVLTESEDRAAPARDDATSLPVDLVANADAIGPRPAGDRRARALTPVVMVSVAAHLLLLATVLLLSRAPSAPAQSEETAVEVVQEAPSEKAGKADAASAKPGEKQKEPSQPPQDRQPEKAQPREASLPPPQPPGPAEPPKQAPQANRAQQPQARPQPSDAAAKLEALRQELASLQAEKTNLQQQAEAEHEAQMQAEAQAKIDTQARARAAAADQTKALGLLPESFSAAALPPVSPAGEDPISYEQAVYSLVNKARRSDRPYMPGVAHVVFDIDAKGGLARVVVDHSSGNAATDEEAVALIRRAAPFPPPPNGTPRSFPAYMSFVADH